MGPRHLSRQTLSGSVDLPVAAGDTYGFEMSGNNYDSDDRLFGTLRLSQG